MYKLILDIVSSTGNREFSVMPKNLEARQSGAMQAIEHASNLILFRGATSLPISIADALLWVDGSDLDDIIHHALNNKFPDLNLDTFYLNSDYNQNVFKLGSHKFQAVRNGNLIQFNKI